MQNQLGKNIQRLHHWAIYRKDCFFLGVNEEVQKEPPKAGAHSEIFQGKGSFGELGH